jgi:glutathione S-transferase
VEAEGWSRPAIELSGDRVQHRLLAFQRRYEQTAVRFAWRFTRADLIGCCTAWWARSGR